MKFDNTYFSFDYQNFSLFTVDRIPFRLISLRQAIRKTYDLYIDRIAEYDEVIRLRDLHVHFVLARIDW